jgi:LPS sulfotransferase NodH
VQTRQWRTQDVRRGEPSYDASLIAGLIELIGWETHGWRAWFDAQRVEPLVVTYEELLADRAAAVCRIAEAAGVALPDVVPLHPYPGRERQADELNEDWARRYRTEVGA